MVHNVQNFSAILSFQHARVKALTVAGVDKDSYSRSATIYTYSMSLEQSHTPPLTPESAFGAGAVCPWMEVMATYWDISVTPHNQHAF
jgi:hypothetical protein